MGWGPMAASVFRRIDRGWRALSLRRRSPGEPDELAKAQAKGSGIHEAFAFQRSAGSPEQPKNPRKPRSSGSRAIGASRVECGMVGSGYSIYTIDYQRAVPLCNSISLICKGPTGAWPYGHKQNHSSVTGFALRIGENRCRTSLRYVGGFRPSGRGGNLGFRV